MTKSDCNLSHHKSILYDRSKVKPIKLVGSWTQTLIARYVYTLDSDPEYRLKNYYWLNYQMANHYPKWLALLADHRRIVRNLLQNGFFFQYDDIVVSIVVEIKVFGRLASCPYI